MTTWREYKRWEDRDIAGQHLSVYDVEGWEGAIMHGDTSTQQGWDNSCAMCNTSTRRKFKTPQQLTLHHVQGSRHRFFLCHTHVEYRENIKRAKAALSLKNPPMELIWRMVDLIKLKTKIKSHEKHGITPDLGQSTDPDNKRPGGRAANESRRKPRRGNNCQLSQ